MSVVAFCLLSYRRDHPSGMERGIATLTDGVRRLGHTALIIAAGPPSVNDELVDLVRLRSVRLPRPATNDDVLAALADPGPVASEVKNILRSRQVDVVCWAETLWGLGYLSPAPAGVKTALLVHKLRSSGGRRWRQALHRADLVCAASDYVRDQATAVGVDTSGWVAVPHAVEVVNPTPLVHRERARRHGPIRVVSRADPAKGLTQLIREIPAGWNRRVELVLAEADFESSAGMQREVLAECHHAASQRPDVVTILPALPWHRVPVFLGAAAATVIASTEPETFCRAAAEALSAGTPVISFDLGSLPALVGPAGRTVPLQAGHTALWAALYDLLVDSAAYHEAAVAAPGRVSGHDPAYVARELLDAAGLSITPHQREGEG